MKKDEYVKECVCQRCGHKWIPRKKGRPALCPNRKCHSPYWDVPREEK